MGHDLVTSTVTYTTRSDFIFYFSSISLVILTVLFIFYICYVVRRREIERPLTVHIPHPHPQCDVEASIAAAKHVHCPRARASRSRSRSVSSVHSDHQSSTSRRARSERRRRESPAPEDPRKEVSIPIEPRVSFEKVEEEDDGKLNEQPKSRPEYSKEVVQSSSDRIFSRELVEEERVQKEAETSEKSIRRSKNGTPFKTPIKSKSSTKTAKSGRDYLRGSTPDSSPRASSNTPSSKDNTPGKVSSKDKSPHQSRTSKCQMRSETISDPSSAPRPAGSRGSTKYPGVVTARSKTRNKSHVSPVASSGSRFTEFTLPPSTVSTQQEYVSERAPFE